MSSTTLSLVIKPTDGREPVLISIPPSAPLTLLKQEAARALLLQPSDFALSFNGRVLRTDENLTGITNLSTLLASVSVPRSALTAGPATRTARPPASPPAAAGSTTTLAAVAPANQPTGSLRALEEESDDCAICLETYVVTAPPCTLACGHAFHATCITEWTHVSAYCPMCRGVIRFPVGAAVAAPRIAAVGGNQPVALVSAAPTHLTYLTEPASASSLSPPSLSELQTLLRTTRARLAASSEWRTLSTAARAISSSDTGKATLAVGRAAARAAVDVGNRVLQNIVSAAVTAVVPPASPAGSQANGANAVVATPLTTPNARPPAPYSYAPQQQQPQQQPPAGWVQQQQWSPQQQQQLAWGQSGGGGATSTYLQALVRCPACAQVLLAPYGAPAFRCPCGQVLHR